MSGELVFLVEPDAYHKASGHLHRFYFSTGPFQCRRTDELADLPYAPLVEQAADVSLAISSYGDVAGTTAVEVGQIILANRLDWQRRIPIRGRDLATGALVTLPAAARPLNPFWTDYVLAGHRLAVYVGPADGSRDADFTPICVIGQEMPELIRTGIVLSPRDKALDFDTPLQVETYGGTGGLDGTTDQKGKTKERCFGWVLSFEPTYLGINAATGKHRYSVNGGHPIEGIVHVRDGYVDLTEVTSGTPSSGQWKQDKATGTFELGGSLPAFGLTCEAKGDKTGGTWRNTIADLIRFWATTHSGILADPAGIDVAAFAALNVVAPYTIGLWLPVGDTTTLGRAFDQAAQSTRAFWLVDEAERLSVGQALPASGTPARRLLRGIHHNGLSPISRAGRDTPAKAVLIRSGQNHAVADAATLDRALSGDARNIATTQWRESRTPEDAGVVAAYGANIARLVERDTLLRFQADGDTEAAALLADAKVPRQTFELPCTQIFADVRRLDVIEVEDDLAGFETGKLLRVIGVRVNQRAKLSTFILRE